ASPHTLFKHFETDPVASASIAQVHFAVLHDGRDVAVKVLRPGMRDIIEKDLSLLRALAGLVERWAVECSWLKPRQVITEIDNYLHDELDLISEAANCRKLRRNFSAEAGHEHLLMIPEVVWEHCAPKVFTIERMRGIRVSQIERLQA